MDITDRQRPVKFISGAQRHNRLRRDLRVQAHFIEITSRGKNRKREGKEGNAQEQESSVSGAAQQITHHDSAHRGRAKSRGGAAPVAGGVRGDWRRSRAHAPLFLRGVPRLSSWSPVLGASAYYVQSVS